MVEHGERYETGMSAWIYTDGCNGSFSTFATQRLIFIIIIVNYKQFKSIHNAVMLSVSHKFTISN